MSGDTFDIAATLKVRSFDISEALTRLYRSNIVRPWFRQWWIPGDYTQIRSNIIEQQRFSGFSLGAFLPTIEGYGIVWDVRTPAEDKDGHVYVNRASILMALANMATKCPMETLAIIGGKSDDDATNIFGQFVAFGEAFSE